MTPWFELADPPSLATAARLDAIREAEVEIRLRLNLRPISFLDAAAEGGLRRSRRQVGLGADGNDEETAGETQAGDRELEAAPAPAPDAATAGPSFLARRPAVRRRSIDSSGNAFSSDDDDGDDDDDSEDDDSEDEDDDEGAARAAFRRRKAKAKGRATARVELSQEETMMR